jgi:cell wall-associated NlpC family hydrolase
MSFAKNKNGIGALIVLTLLTTTVQSDLVFAKTPKPTQAQIDAAKAVEAAKAVAANTAAAKLRSATKTLNQLTVISDNARASYNRAVKELAIAIFNAKAAAEHAALTQAAVNAANRTIGKMASNAYKMGGDFTNINSVLSASGPQDLIDRLTTLDKLGASNSTALKRFQAAQVVAKAAQQEADRTKLAQVAATNKVAAAKKIADEAKAAQQVEVDKLKQVQNKLATELAQAKNTRVTLEQQRQLALLEEANANIAANTPGQFKVWPDRGFTGRSTIRSSESIRAAAVAFAKKQVQARKPYIWGAQGPNAFDCSGLVYAAYKSAGLNYPTWGRLNAALYFVSTKRVPFSELLPGDLLFYSYDGSVQNIHHITIYAGNGMMWEANSRKIGLIYSNMYSIKGLMPSGGRV